MSKDYQPSRHEADELNQLSSWTINYYNDHIYSGANGRSLSKSTPLLLAHGGVDKPSGYFSAYSQRPSGLMFPTSGTPAEQANYQRQFKNSLQVNLRTETAIPGDFRATTESVKLLIDADGAVVDGSYKWQGPEQVERPAADVEDFLTAEAAELAGVTGRTVELLGRFRYLVLDGSDMSLTRPLGDNKLQDFTTVPEPRLRSLPELLPTA